MSNAYYNYSGAFIPGTLARAEAEAAEFIAVQNGFNALSTSGTESGSGNAFLVTTVNPATSYSDGYPVYFKATHSNSGAATINVNSIGSVSLLRNNGTAAQTGDLVSGTWYYAVYNSTYSGFTILAPLNITVFTGAISAAAPTYKVGLTAAGGVSTAAMPIDAKFAIDQAIAPTWSAAHTWTANMTIQGDSTKFVVLNSAATTVGAIGTVKAVLGSGTDNTDMAISSQGTLAFYPGGGSTAVMTLFGISVSIVKAVSISSPLSIPLQVTGPSGSYAGLFSNGGSSGNSFGVKIIAGTTSADSALLVVPETGVSTYLQIKGDGSGSIGYNGSNSSIVFANTGGVLINAPNADLGLQVYGAANKQTLYVNAAAGNGQALTVFANASNTAYAVGIFAGSTPGSSNGIKLNAGSNSSDYCVVFQQTISAGNNLLLVLKGDGSGSIGCAVGTSSTTINFSTNGNVTLAAPSSGDTLTVAPSATTGALIATSTALGSNAGATSPTLGSTGPTGATTPTKWIKINDNGTIRSIPAW